MPLKTCFRDPLRMPMRSRPIQACGGAGGISLSAFTAKRLALPSFPNLIDLDVDGADVWVQFGDSGVLDDFDVALAMSYPRTGNYGVEKIGVPVGATHVAFLPQQLGTTTRVRQRAEDLATFDGYGAAVRSFKCSVTGSTFGATMAAAVTNAPVFMAMRCRTSNTGSAGANHFFSLVPATDINTGVFTLRKNSGAASDTWAALYKATAANTTVANSPASASNDEWTTVYGWFTLTTEVDAQVGFFDDISFDRISAVTSGAHVYAGPQTRVAVGGIVNATGQGFMLADDEFVCGIAYIGTMPTHLQAQELASADCDLWSNVIAGWGGDTTKIMTWVMVDRDGNLRDKVSGRVLTELTGFTAGTFAAAAYAGPHLRQPNRIVTQSASSVLDIAYSNVASGVVALPVMPSCQWRSAQHHKLRYDIGAAANPATAFVTIEAGVGNAYGSGGVNDINAINDSGAAGDTGVMNLTGLTHLMDLYVPAQSGLAYTQTAGTVLYTASVTDTAGEAPGTKDRKWRMTKPNTGSDWPLVVVAVGAGGLHTEYDDFATSLASCGYCVIVLSFADQTEAFPWNSFDYPERCNEYLEFLEDKAVTIAGYTPTRYITVGHSGGAATMMNAIGLQWLDTTPITGGQQGPIVAVPDGGGTILGALCISGQGVQTDQKHMTIEAGAWDEINVPIFYYTNADDSGGVGGGSPTDRLTGYDQGPADLPSLKSEALTGGHLYGGSLSTETISTTVSKRRERISRLLHQNMWVCACDYFDDVAGTAERLRHGWDDRQRVVYAHRNI